MKTTSKLSDGILGLLTFLVPFILYRLTSVNALMFDDAAEFALVIKLGSIAHPPGTPAYILLAGLWEKLATILGMGTIDALNMFASMCVSIASVMLFLSLKLIAKELTQSDELRNSMLAAIVAIAFACGETTWAWGNTIEVYSFQLLAMALALYGLTVFQIKRTNVSLIIAGIGIGIGLANHHLTMILFLPFTPFFFTNGLFRIKTTDPKKKKVAEETLIAQFIKSMRSRSFILLALCSAGVMIIFYGWMYVRAQQEYAFMFGQPNSLGSLFYHLKGGSYSKNLTSASNSIISSRFPYFLKLTFWQLFLFFPLFILGVITLFKNKLKALSFVVLLNFTFLFLYQLNNNQWSSTDAYMLLPFYLLSIAVFIGAIRYSDKFKLTYVLPFLLVGQIIFFYKEHDRKTYPVSTSLMNLLDKSSPKNSVVLISDWSTVIQYYYYRIVENFRPDLVVLNYDFKFTHYRILPIMYPEFYKKIQPEYDAFVNALREEHPDQVTNTGCDLSTTKLSDCFRAVVLKSQSVCASENIPFLTDPKANYFFSTQKFYEPKRFVSGCFMSTIPGDSISASTFLAMDFPFLKSPLLLNDPSSLDKIVDFQAMLDGHIESYKANNNQVLLAQAENSRERILKLQRDLRKSMSFAFKIK